jgi:hypothetical protein
MKILKNILSTFSILLFSFSMNGCLVSTPETPENLQVARLYLETVSMNYGAISNMSLKLPQSGTEIKVFQEPLFNEFDIIDAEMVKVDLGAALLLKLNDAGARKLYRSSVSKKGSRLVLVVNDKPIGSRRLDGAIMDGDYYTFVELDAEELGEMVLAIKGSISYLQAKAKSNW